MIGELCERQYARLLPHDQRSVESTRKVPVSSSCFDSIYVEFFFIEFFSMKRIVLVSRLDREFRDSEHIIVVENSAVVT